jgi:hypothetical protein
VCNPLPWVDVTERFANSALHYEIQHCEHNLANQDPDER